MTTDIATQLAKHQQHATELQAKLDQQAAAEHAKRGQRLAEYDQQTVVDYPDQEASIKAAEDAARDAFIEAVKADPACAAWIKYRAARWRRTHLRSHVQAAAHGVGVDGPADLAYRDPRLFEDILQLCEDAARDIAAIEQDERTNRRTDAGQGKVTAP